MPDALKKILREDPNFPSWLQFEELRRLGIEYIAKFSGDVWTDHNLHDPGITILEVLCYALSDLGYRTQLDIEELLAPPAPLDRDDNFHTPAQILSCNPLTILDYRKMLLDIQGVRNAWLVPAEAQEVPLFVDCKTGALGFSRLSKAPDCDEVALPASAQELKLNGLYKVLLDLDPVLTNVADENCESGGDKTGSILQEVKRRLLRHRNLSEDFLDIIVLEDEQIGVCADIELKPTANPDEVLLKVYEAIELFLSPRVPFYTLPQMLRRGKTMEDIFAGRPYILDSHGDLDSHGFIDAEELAGLDLPEVLRASDFYQVIMDVEGVRAIKDLYLASFVEGVQRTVEQAWTLGLMPNHRPVFAPAISQFKFHKGSLRLAANASVVANRFKKRLLDFQKNKLSPELLDQAVPYGQHRADLADYWSIQHEFPLTYRIGEGEMPDTASEERKVKALQLKGYLAFYDQLLADYLSQLGHFRQLLSWEDQPQTYFPQPVDTMPEGARIFRFDADGTARQGETLAQATQVFPHPTARDMAIEQLRAAFENYGEALVSVVEDEQGGYRFYAYSAPGGEAVLASAQRYESEAAARLDAQALAFLGILPQSYEKQNRAAAREYAFQFVYTAVSYQRFLQRIAEPQPLDYGRRDAFLNHLLARFGEQFTEYVLLMYALNQGEVDDEKIIRDKARFLQNYGDIGRNRGRGFDYGDAEELWDSDANISGFERRVGALMGLDNWQRRNLNAFSVTIREEACRLRILDHRGQVILETVATFATDEEREALEGQVVQALEGERYERIDCGLESAYSFRLLGKNGKPIALHPRDYGSAALRDEALACTQMYFGEPLDLLVLPVRDGAGWRFWLELGGRLPGSHEGGEGFRSDDVFEAQAEAEEAGKRLLRAIRAGHAKLLKMPSGQKTGFGITLKGNSGDLPTARWHKLYEARELRNERHGVLDRYLGALLPQPAGIRVAIVPTAAGYYFLLLGPEGQEYFKSSRPYPTEREACLAWVVFARLARSGEAYTDIAGSFPDGPLSFAVEAEGERLAHWPKGASDANAREVQKREVAAYIASKSLRHDIRRQPDTYKWYVEQEGARLLESVQNFKNAPQARAAFRLFQAWGAAPENYRTEAVEGGGERFAVLREDGLALARSPVWGSPEESAKRQAQLIGMLASAPEAIPAPGIALQPAEYRFVLYGADGEEALLGLRTYPDAEAAECAYYHFTAWAAETGNYRFEEEAHSCRYRFAVHHPDTGERLAEHPQDYLEREAKQAQRRLADYIAAYRLPMYLTALPESWHYRIYWESCDGSCQPLLVGAQEHDSELGAKEALADFLNSYAEGNLKDILGEEGYSFNYNLDESIPEGFLAYHPFHYATKAERDRVLEDAIAYLKHYLGLADGTRALFTKAEAWFVCGDSPKLCPADADEEEDEDDAPEEVPETTEEVPPRLLSAYRLGKSDQPVAVHPRRFYSKAERNEVLEDLLERAECGLLRYSSLCLQGTRLVQEAVEGEQRGYRYALCDNGPEQTLLWLSHTLFGSAAAAQEAFQADWLHILELSLRQQHYVLLAGASPRLELRAAGAERPIAFYPLPSDEDDAVNAAREARQRFARLYPLRRAGDRYRFRVLDYEGAPSDAWQSGQDYATAAEAWQAFQHFWELLRRRPNYFMANDWNACIFQLQIVETLLEGVRTYSDRFTAETLAIYEASTFGSPKAAAAEMKTLLSEARAAGRGRRGTVVEVEDPRTGELAYEFRLVRRSATDVVTFRSAAQYRSEAEVEQAAARFWRYLPYDSNFRVIELEEGQYTIAMVRVTRQGEEPPEEQPVLAACPAISALPAVAIGDTEVLILEHCDLAAGLPEGSLDFCPRAWDLGLQNFLIHAVGDYAFYPFVDVQEGCGHSFRVVTDNYRVARHPAQYHTVGERATVLDWLFGYSRCHKDMPNFSLDVCRKGRLIHYRIKIVDNEEDGGDEVILWRSYQGYESESAAGQAHDNERLILLGYARELDFYELERMGTDEDDRPLYQIQLVDDQGQVLAVVPGLFAEGWNEAILERIQYARQHPYYLEGGRYGFRCYSLENSPLYVPPPPSDCPPPAQLIEVEVPGAVIWESVYDYATLDEAACVFHVFMCLLKDKSNIQRVQDSHCGLFGLELTHPQEVLAEHPQRYRTRAEADAAVERARACINAEGFHLVEHILLRPKQGASTHITLQFWLPEEAELCQTEDENGEPIEVPMRPYLLLNTIYYTAEAAAARKEKVIRELLAALAEVGQGEVDRRALEDRLRRIPGITVANIPVLAAYFIGWLEENPDQRLEAADLEAMIFCFDKSEGQVADRLIDACPACCEAVPLPVESLEADCEGLEKGQAPEEAPGAGWYIPDADPYSFWMSIVLPYWPQRFQNANFRSFFEETLRREAPAHIGLRICWLDSKQMLDFERRYRAWLEAFSGGETCRLQSAQSDLIGILFGMTTVYPPARLQGGACGQDGNSVGGILLDFTQLG